MVSEELTSNTTSRLWTKLLCGDILIMILVLTYKLAAVATAVY